MKNVTLNRATEWTLEQHVNDYVKRQLEKIGLQSIKDYNVEQAMNEHLKKALQGGSKTKTKTSFGIPDLNITKYQCPVIIEDKLGTKKFKAENKDGIKFDNASVSGFAVNGVLHYARCIIDSDSNYKEVVALAVAGNNENDIQIAVYYVYGSTVSSFKLIESAKNFNFLENERTFNAFLSEARLKEEEKREIVQINSERLRQTSKTLNKLMHNHNITAAQRVLYVSGSLLAMQDIQEQQGSGTKRNEGLTPEKLTGSSLDGNRDGQLIVRRIEQFLKHKNIDADKSKLMLASFQEISKDSQRDEPCVNDKKVAEFLETDASINKQIFTFLYEQVFKNVDVVADDIDIMGEMYSEFLKYALGDGKELGIVLTPRYVTAMMAEILEITAESRVMDLAAGSAGFLIAAMKLMIAKAETELGKETSPFKEKKRKIKAEQLLGVELNAEMYTLAATNMILRGDGSSNIQKANTFSTPEKLYADFDADRLLLNPPFSYKENGMPFIAFGLDKMQKGGLGAIIIQDSAGSGKAENTNRQILKAHTLLASIKMPVDLFQPMAGVQTSIYVFQAGTPHNFDKTVKFIDFRNDGYKRTSRSLQEIDSPAERYQDIIKIYNAGHKAKVHAGLWNLEEVYTEDFITESGNDWNFDQHKKIDTKPTLQDFKKTVSDYLAWEVSEILKNEGSRVGKQ